MIYNDPSPLPLSEVVPFELLDFGDEILLEMFEKVINFQNLTCQDLRTLNALKAVCHRFKVILSGIPLKLTISGPLSVEAFRCLRVARGVYATFARNFTGEVELRSVLDDLLGFCKFNTLVISSERDRSNVWLQRDYANLSMFLNSSFIEGREKAELAEIFFELLKDERIQEFSDANPFTLPKFCANLIKCFDKKFDANLQENLENDISSRNITDPLILSLFFRICTNNPESDITLLLKSDRFRSINSPFLFELAEKIYASRNDEEAGRIYNKMALELNPDSVSALVTSLNYLNNEMGRDKALSNVNKALKLNPYYVEAWVGRGFIYSRMGAYDFALDDFTAALKLNPHHIMARGFRGELHYCMGANDLAVEDLNIAINLNSEYTKARELRAEIYCRTGKKSLALADYDAILRQDPNHVVARKSRGEFHMYKGNYGLALADLNVALQVNPNFIRAHVLRGAVYFRMEMYEQASADIEKAASIDPTHPSVLRAQSILRAKQRQIPNDAVGDYAPKNSDTNKRVGSTYESDSKRR